MGVAQRANRSSSNMLNLFFSSLLISSTLALVQPLSREQPETKDLLCDICIDVITDLDQWLTSDSTEDQIVEWIEQVCDLLSAIVPEAICKSLIESQIPAIIDGLVNDNLKPRSCAAASEHALMPQQTHQQHLRPQLQQWEQPGQPCQIQQQPCQLQLQQTHQQSHQD